jgi:hypothetical protein
VLKTSKWRDQKLEVNMSGLELVLIIVSFLLSSVESQNDCSQYFHSVNENGQIQGRLEIPTDPVAPEHKVRIMMTVAAQLPSVSHQNAFEQKQ